MNNNQQKEKTSKKSTWSNLLIIFLVAIIMVTSSIGIFAWAKYKTATNGSATAQVAKWSFKLVDGITETSDVIDFAFTRTDGYEHVEEGALAPGTFGEFEIGIDARGTETILKYVIDVELENKPKNLKLYYDSAKTKEITVSNNEFTINGNMDLEDVKEIKTVKIYWDWPYESGDDEQDTKDAGKNVTMKVSVTGTELPELLEFNIEGVTYYAIEGMTWGEWVESEYDTGNHYWDNYGYLTSSKYGSNNCVYGIVNIESLVYDKVKKSDIIYSNKYTIERIIQGGAAD